MTVQPGAPSELWPRSKKMRCCARATSSSITGERMFIGSSAPSIRHGSGPAPGSPARWRLSAEQAAAWHTADSSLSASWQAHAPAASGHPGTALSVVDSYVGNHQRSGQTQDLVQHDLVGPGDCDHLVAPEDLRQAVEGHSLIDEVPVARVAV